MSQKDRKNRSAKRTSRRGVVFTILAFAVPIGFGTLVILVFDKSQPREIPLVVLSSEVTDLLGEERSLRAKRDLDDYYARYESRNHRTILVTATGKGRKSVAYCWCSPCQWNKH